MSTVTEIIEQARAVVDGAEGLAPAVTSRPVAKRTSADLAGRIDHTLLKPDAAITAIEQLCVEAVEHGFASACVNSTWVPLVAELVSGSDVLVCSVVGFPLGAMATHAKAQETADAVAAGADEIDMVINVGRLKSGEYAEVLDDIRAVVVAADGKPVKVIIETCLLDEIEKAVACLLSVRAGAAYVKTSTGFSSGGATADDIALMRAVVGDELGVKASGGVRTRADADTMIAAGADRIGASASIAIASGADSAGSGY